MNSGKYTVSAAHRITGKARGTIISHMKTGKLSHERDENNNPVIDAAELMRVYGDACNFDRAGAKPKTTEQITSSIAVQVKEFEQSLVLAEQENRHLREKIEMHVTNTDRLNELLDEANKQIASTQFMLTDERQRRADLEQETKDRKQGFFSRMFR